MSNEKKYPCIVNRSGQTPKYYIGIMFNGDQGVYRKATVKALKKSGASKTHINAVKAADGDLAISKILIEADLFDVLVDVFKDTDSRTAVLDYIDGLYSSIVDESITDLSSITVEFSKTASSLSQTTDIHTVLTEVDKCIDEHVVSVCKKLEDIHEETAKAVLRKYHEACARKLQKLEKEIQDMKDEKKRLEAIIQKIN